MFVLQIYTIITLKKKRYEKETFTLLIINY